MNGKKEKIKFNEKIIFRKKEKKVKLKIRKKIKEKNKMKMIKRIFWKML